MIKLSVNINKIATLRNARGENQPDLLKVAKDIQKFGANGITIHPRPDQRHIKFNDVFELKNVITTEFNIEGNPSLEFLRLVKKNLPDQVTLVPDSEKVITSDSGWDTVSNKFFLIDVINELKELGIRTSIFVDPDQKMIDGALESGADRIELYTKNFADLYPINPKKAIQRYIIASDHANSIGIGINAGHDLSLENIEFFSKNIKNLKEVSIGHALICESLYFGFENIIKKYLKKLV